MLTVLDGSVHAASANRPPATTRSRVPNLAISLGRTVSAPGSVGPGDHEADRGMRAPVLAVGDGALGFRGALREVFPEARERMGKGFILLLTKMFCADKLPRLETPKPEILK